MIIYNLKPLFKTDMLETVKTKEQRKCKRQWTDTNLLNIMLTKNGKPNLYPFIYKCHLYQ